MRAIWKGAVSFGLVSVPVKLYAATESHDVSFRQVHAKDGGRIKYQRVCSLDGEEVAYADIAKGYETEDGEMVILTDDDMAELPSTSSREIAVEKFVPREQIDPLLFEKSYYLEPEGAGAKPYALLRQALLDADRMAVVTVALRQRTSIAVLRVKDDVIVLQTMMWPDEIRTPDFTVEPGDVKAAEVKMAHMLVETLAGDFDATEFEDDYAGAVEALVKSKIEGGEIKRTETSTKTSGEVVDLLAALQKSVAAAKTARGEDADEADDEAGEEDGRQEGSRQEDRREEGAGQEDRREEDRRQERSRPPKKASLPRRLATLANVRRVSDPPAAPLQAQAPTASAPPTWERAAAPTPRRPRRRRGRARGSPSTSGTTCCTIPSASRSVARTRWRVAISAAWSTSPCTITLAPSGGSGESQACSVAMTVRAGRNASAPPPQPWPRITETVGTVIVVRVAMQRAISPAMARSSASGDSSAPGVSITVTSGRPSSSASRMPRRASRSAPGPIAWPGAWRARSWPTTTHGWSSMRVSATITVESRSPSSVPRSWMVPLGAVGEEVAQPGPVRTPGALDAVPRARAGQRPRRAAGQPAGAGCVDQHGEGEVDHRGQVLGGDDAVDDAGGGEVLRHLDAGTERPAVERLVDLRAEEADQRAGLGDGHVPERAPRGVDAAGRGVAQVHEVGQAGGPVLHQRAGDLGHPHEGGRALLHAGAARRGAGQQRQALGGGAAYGCGDPVGGGAADRAGEEAELVDHDRHRPAADLAAAGEHGLVGAGLGGRGLEHGAVAGLDRRRSIGSSHDVKVPGSSTRSSSSWRASSASGRADASCAAASDPGADLVGVLVEQRRRGVVAARDLGRPRRRRTAAAGRAA